MMKKDKINRERHTFTFSPETANLLRDYCERNDKIMSRFIERLIVEKLTIERMTGPKI